MLLLTSSTIHSQEVCNGSISYIYKSVSITDSNILNAMDTCVSILHNCQFFKDDVCSEVIITQIPQNDNILEGFFFRIIPKDYHKVLSYIEEFPPNWLSALHCAYRNVNFVFLLHNPEENCFQVTGGNDTINYEKYSIIYQYTKIQDTLVLNKCGSKCTELLEGLVFLYKSPNNKWQIRTVDCAQIDENSVIVNNKRIKLYLKP